MNRNIAGIRTGSVVFVKDIVAEGRMNLKYAETLAQNQTNALNHSLATDHAVGQSSGQGVFKAREQKDHNRAMSSLYFSSAETESKTVPKQIQQNSLYRALLFKIGVFNRGSTDAAGFHFSFSFFFLLSIEVH